VAASGDILQSGEAMRSPQARYYGVEPAPGTRGYFRGPVRRRR
jgi:hypothetical protein